MARVEDEERTVSDADAGEPVDLARPAADAGELLVPRRRTEHEQGTDVDGEVFRYRAAPALSAPAEPIVSTRSAKPRPAAPDPTTQGRRNEMLHTSSALEPRRLAERELRA